MHTIRVSYDASFSRPNTWILHQSRIGIRLRWNRPLLVGVDEVVLDVPVRFIRSASATAIPRVTIRPLNAVGSRWASEPHDFQEPIGRAEIVLVACPSVVAEALRQL